MVNPNEPEMIPDIVPVIEFATCTVELAAKATVPDNVPAAEKFTAPADETPVPEIVNGSADVTSPISSVAPASTVVPALALPSALACVTFRVPFEIVVRPVYKFAVESVNVVAAPTLTTLPLPVIDPLKLVLPAEPEVSVAEPSEIVPAPVIEPTVSDTLLRSKVPVTETADKSGTEPEPESRRVPNEIVVELVYALTASVTNTPAPDLVKVEIGVSIGSDTVILPAPVNVIAVALVASNALPEATSNVNVPAELPIVAAALSVTAPVTVLLLARLSKAPVPEPLAAIVNGSETESTEPSK